jgi:16S rRNA processing protein RimM
MARPPADPPGTVCVGAIAGAFGVKGEVRVKSFCADPAAVGDYGPLVTADGRTVEIRLGREIKGAFAARLSIAATREEAEALKGTRLYAPRERLPSLPDDEFYHADLIGLPVLDTGGAEIGRVHAVHDFGAGDILEIARPGAKAVMLPFTRDAVPTVDLAAGRIIADPPAGAVDPGGDDGEEGR